MNSFEDSGSLHCFNTNLPQIMWPFCFRDIIVDKAHSTKISYGTATVMCIGYDHVSKLFTMYNKHQFIENLLDDS